MKKGVVAIRLTTCILVLCTLSACDTVKQQTYSGRALPEEEVARLYVVTSPFKAIAIDSTPYKLRHWFKNDHRNLFSLLPGEHTFSLTSSKKFRLLVPLSDPPALSATREEILRWGVNFRGETIQPECDLSFVAEAGKSYYVRSDVRAQQDLRACAKTIPQFLQDNEGRGALKNSVFSLQIARIGRFGRVLQAFEKTAELFLHNS